MARSPLGNLVVRSLEELTVHFPEIHLDEWVVMPDHFHLLAWLGDGPRGPGARHGVGEIIGKLKAAVTRIGRREGLIGDGRLWQRGYYVRLIRDPKEVQVVRRYIRNNPRDWLARRQRARAAR